MALRFKRIPIPADLEPGYCEAFQSADAYGVCSEQGAVYAWLRAEFTPLTWRMDSDGFRITIAVTDPAQAVAFRLRWC